VPGAVRARVVLLSGKYSDYEMCGECDMTPANVVWTHRRNILAVKHEVERVHESVRTDKPRTEAQLANLRDKLARYATDLPVGVLSVSPPPTDFMMMERPDG